MREQRPVIVVGGGLAGLVGATLLARRGANVRLFEGASALGGRAGDPAANDAEVAAVREAARLIAEDERLTPVLIPLGDGILVAARD